MIADQNFYDICFTFFYPTASATAYGRRPKFVRAKHSATAEGENCTYGPTLLTDITQQPNLPTQAHHTLCAQHTQLTAILFCCLLHKVALFLTGPLHHLR